MTSYATGTEAQIHQAVVDWLNLVKPDCWWSTIEHGASGVKQSTRNKKRGVVSGIPDLMFVREGKVYWIELKAKNQYPKPVQKACHQALHAHGSHVAVCRSQTEVEGTLAAWGMVRAA